MFVFRNFTVENLFPEGTRFSGYDDVAHPEGDESVLVWFFQVPLIQDKVRQIEAVKSMGLRLQLMMKRVSFHTSVYIISLENLFPIKYDDSDERLEDAVARFNSEARQYAETMSNVFFVDFGEFLSRYPSKDWINWRFYFISQMILNPSLAPDFRIWWNESLYRIKGVRKKCLVLDLDNTLWGGILGEDGITGIQIGGDYPGNAFEFFQKGLVALSQQGVILTVCSKNNEEDVLDVWAKNPFIVLNDSHLAAWEINWDDKATNIKRIAERLNIGLESMVLIDDNPSERQLIKQELPMVAAPDFPKKPYGLPEFFNSIVNDYFRTYSLTEEDKYKVLQYKAKIRRDEEESHFSNMKEFIKSLRIKLLIQQVNEFNVRRLAQLTQKTNQFNLTTRRYSESDIMNMKENGSKVFSLSVSDRFGDNGITGEAICNLKGDHAEIDTFLLSCRVLGKGIEYAFANSVVNILRKEGIKTISASYTPTSKNIQTADFYPRLGFQLVGKSDDGSSLYILNLKHDMKIDDSYEIQIL